jgi:hypothetical protein
MSPWGRVDGEKARQRPAIVVLLSRRIGPETFLETDWLRVIPVLRSGPLRESATGQSARPVHRM